MITIAAVLARLPTLDATTLEFWIAEEWVRPARHQGAPVFQEIDVARARLILELRDDLALGEPAIPVILSLLDQLHTTRNQLRQLLDTIPQPDPPSP